MIPEGSIFHKPKSFVTAKNLLYASIFLGILNEGLVYFTIGFINNALIESVIAVIISLLIIFLLVKQMSFCRKWARTIFLVLFIGGMIGFPFMLIQLFRQNIIVAALSVLQAALQFIALFFLYTKESNVWFNSTTSEVLP
jgi:hypothetical protein